MWKSIDTTNRKTYPKQMEFVPIAIYAGGQYLKRVGACYVSNTQDMKWMGVDGRNIVGTVSAWYDVPDYQKVESGEEHY